MYSRMLIPTDGSLCSELAMNHGLELARNLGARVTFLFVLEIPPTGAYVGTGMVPYEPKLLDKLKEHAREVLARAEAAAREVGVEATSRLVEHVSPARAINEAEPDFDLIMLGTHGRRGLNRWMFGSVAERALRRSGVPYLVVRCAPEEGGDEASGA